MSRLEGHLPEVSGLSAVALALGLAELFAGVLQGVPSLVSSVGAAFIPVVPAALEDAAIRAFGTSDKAVLSVGVAVITLAIGGVAGRMAVRSITGAAWLYTGFTMVGLVAAWSQPLADIPLTTLSLSVAAAAGWLALRRMTDGLTVVAAGSSGAPASVATAAPRRLTTLERRRFMAAAGITAAAGALGGAAGRSLLRGSSVVDLEQITLPDPASPAGHVGAANAFSLPGLDPLVVPNEEFFRIDTALSVPRIDPETWTLRIVGMVDREIELTYRDLLARPLIERHVTIACVSNEVGGRLVGNAVWLGVPLSDVLAEAGVQPGAGQLVGRSVDRWTAGFPTALAEDGRDAMIAVGMNGEPLPLEHGFPARLIIPGLYGYVSATKWLEEIELTTWEGFDAYWVPRGWAKEGPVKTQSRIDVPPAGARLAPGDVTVAGVAWAPTRGIARVEVGLDEDGWSDAELTEPVTADAWVQWRVTLRLTPGTHRIRVRATDGDGERQTEEVTPPRPDGATGWHTIRVSA